MGNPKHYYDQFTKNTWDSTEDDQHVSCTCLSFTRVLQLFIRTVTGSISLPGTGDKIERYKYSEYVALCFGMWTAARCYRITLEFEAKQQRGGHLRGYAILIQAGLQSTRT
jgi:hypothetical protein